MSGSWSGGKGDRPRPVDRAKWYENYDKVFGGQTVTPEFQGFTKIHRLSRPCIVTEKIDGTNAQVSITPTGEIFAGSRSRWLSLDDDNFGFAKWVDEHREELLGLGSGRHFGEWWGQGIQRGYGLKERRFSLFNVHRWTEIDGADEDGIERVPNCCHVVPIVGIGQFDNPGVVLDAMSRLRHGGSLAAPGFMRPEGIVIYHVQGNVMFKKTFEKDQEGKNQ